MKYKSQMKLISTQSQTSQAILA